MEKWVPKIIRNFKSEDYLHIVEEGGDGGSKEYYIKFNIFTNEYCYSIVAKDIYGEKGYLGCTCSTRRILAGEKHNRGCDLNDGAFVKDTWNGIVSDIVRNELVPLADSVRTITKIEEEEGTLKVNG